MTVSTTTSRVEYAGNGSTTAFSVPFYFLANGDLKVYQGGVLKTITTHYTVSGAGNPAGGTVTFLSAPGSSDDVVIFRDPALTQNVDYVPNDPFPAASHEQALDRLTMIAQRLSDRVGRSFSLADGDTSGASTTLPTPEASKLVGWNPAADALQNYDPADLASVLTYANWQVQTFTGDGSTTSFALTSSPVNVANTDVSIDGVTQVPGTDYSLSGDGLSIVFGTAPGNGTVICCRYGQAAAQGRDDASIIYFLPEGSGAVSRSVQAKLRESVSVLDFGADPTGAVDSSAAIQAATNTGRPVEFPDGTYKAAGVTYSGKVTWFSRGNAKIISDGSILSATSAGGSLIDNLELENITAPWIITRDPSNWTAAVTPVQSNGLGYMPTVNDTDIWSSLTAAQQNQTISPKITLTGDSNITFSRIRGRFVVLTIKDAIDSVFRDCNIRGGKDTYGALVFDNSATQNGSGNSAINNKVTYGSVSGITFMGNSDFVATGNRCNRNGESGIKTYQNAGYYCYRGEIVGNICNENSYDGIDALSSFPASTSILTYHNIVGNRCYRNGGTGLQGDGQGNNYEANHLYFNRSYGFWGVCTNSLISGNKLVDNNQKRNSSTHELLVDVSGVTNNSIIGNKIWSGAGANSSAIYVPNASTSYIANNFAKGSSFYFGNAGSNNSVLENNVDDTTGLVTTQAFTIGFYNNGAVIQHYIVSEAVSGSTQGQNVSRISGATSGFTTTPTGADSSTNFAAGAKIGSANPNYVYLNTAAQQANSFYGVCGIALNDTGNAFGVRVGTESININGATVRRLCFVFFNPTTGAAVNINTTNIPSGKSLQVTFFGKLA